MEKLTFIAEKMHPGITLDAASETFVIYGKSCPENAVDFYKPVLQWLDEYKNNPLEKTVFEFNLQYYNTASSKVFYAILLKLENIHKEGSDVLIKWFYNKNDEMLIDAAQDFRELIDIPMELVEKNDITEV